MRKKYLVTLSILLCVGAYIYGSWELKQIESGWREEWVEMPSPDSADYTILAISWRTIYVETAGQISDCTDYESRCEIANFPNYPSELEPCDFGHVAFKVGSRPQTIKQCHYSNLVAADSVADAYAVVDDNNVLWMWSQTFGGFNPFQFLNLPNLYLCFSVLILIPIWLLIFAIQPQTRRRIKKTFPRYFQQ